MDQREMKGKIDAMIAMVIAQTPPPKGEDDRVLGALILSGLELAGEIVLDLKRVADGLAEMTALTTRGGNHFHIPDGYKLNAANDVIVIDPWFPENLGADADPLDEVVTGTAWPAEGGPLDGFKIPPTADDTYQHRHGDIMSTYRLVWRGVGKFVWVLEGAPRLSLEPLGAPPKTGGFDTWPAEGGPLDGQLLTVPAGDEIARYPGNPVVYRRERRGSGTFGVGKFAWVYQGPQVPPLKTDMTSPEALAAWQGRPLDGGAGG